MFVMWDMHNRTTPEQARKNRERRTSTPVEATTPLYDAGNDDHVVARSGMVHDAFRPDQRPSWSS